MNWNKNIGEITGYLKTLSVRNGKGIESNPNFAFLHWKEQTEKIRQSRKTVYLIGNGASASMASHISADLAKNAFLRTMVFTDPALMTAVSNDMGYEDVFSEPLRRYMENGDMLIAISSSGDSPNVVSACEQAMTLGGYVVTLSAMGSKNQLRSLGCQLNFYVPAETYSGAETCHAAILHYWVDLVTQEHTLHNEVKNGTYYAF